MSRKTVFTKVDAHSFALRFLRTSTEFSELWYCDYWRGLTTDGLPLVGYELDDEIERTFFLLYGAGPSPRFVRRVVRALEVICRNRAGWGVAA
ncbi:hypothetical protein [Hyphomicrobium sp. CS1GBMeth3]|uniref:hypothetical protein n=1 Tax=Hyphomicrobium sp. CS1GBMeth3 TaxID=1892845 RepID=UPI0009311597|nr:hypothetical protein [Hyphomicrobium sp. CS1GBMeth3]